MDSGGNDRLSSLPDDLIHRILSSFDTRDVIEKSVLSSRWRFIWTSMPYLNISTQDFSKLPKFVKFLTNVLSGRDNLTDIYSLNLAFHGKLTQGFVKRVVSYAHSHNVQRMNLVYWPKNVTEFPLCVFSSPSLKHLSLTLQKTNFLRGYRCLLTSTRDFPALTTLDLHHVTLCDDTCADVFLKCPNLRNLTLKEFDALHDGGAFTISHPRLSSLTLDNCSHSVKVVNVAAPQLENLTITFCYARQVVYAPRLASLVYLGASPLHLSTTDGFHSLEKADICVSFPDHTKPYHTLCLLEQLRHVRFLKLNLEIVEFLSLSSSLEFLRHRPSPFLNLKCLKIYPYLKDWFKISLREVAIAPELKSYLLDSSPNCTFTMVLREEILTQRFMGELRAVLDEEKDHGYKPKKPIVGEPVEKIKSCLENLGVRDDLKKEKACVIILKLQVTEVLLTRLPASKRSEFQPSFNCLCAEACIAIAEITECVKIQLLLCDENQVQSVGFLELATALGLSC